MDKINVFLSSCMTGELDSERETLISLFQNNPSLNEIYDLIHITNHARPKHIETAFIEEVENSQSVILLLYNELRDAVVKEFQVAIKNNKKVFCYIKDSEHRHDRMKDFITSLTDNPVTYLPFKNGIDLSSQVIKDIKNDLLETYISKSDDVKSDDFITLPANFGFQYRFFSIDEIKSAANSDNLKNYDSDHLLIIAYYIINEQARYKDALMLIEIAILKNPTNWMAYNNKAHVLDLMGFSDAALFIYKKSIDIHPNEVGYYNIGKVYYDKGQYSEAINSLNESLNINPQKQNALDYLTNCYFRLNDNDNALKFSKISFELDENEISIANYSLALISSKNFKLGKEIYGKLKKDSLFYRKVKSYHMYLTERYDLAIQEIDKIVESGDFDYDAMIRKYYCYLKLEEFKKACEWINVIEDNFPIDAVDYNNLGWTLMNDFKLYKESIPLFEKAIKNNMCLFVAWANLQFAHAQLGDFEKAIEICDKTLLISPGDRTAIQNKANCLASLGKTEEALKFLYSKSEQIKDGNLTDEDIEKKYWSSLNKMGINNDNYGNLINLLSLFYKYMKESSLKN